MYIYQTQLPIGFLIVKCLCGAERIRNRSLVYQQKFHDSFLIKQCLYMYKPKGIKVEIRGIVFIRLNSIHFEIFPSQDGHSSVHMSL